MYIQWFVKGISGEVLDWDDAKRLLTDHHGIQSNWLRGRAGGRIVPAEVVTQLTDANLDSHLHDYDNFGPDTPFISVAAGAVERDVLMQTNRIHPATTTALRFATADWSHPGTLFFGWLPAALNPAIPYGAVAEDVRNLNVYHRWSPFQLEGELTAKIAIPANQIARLEWWDGDVDPHNPIDRFNNPGFAAPAPVTNMREVF